MKLKNLILASTTAMACTFGAATQAQSFIDCVATPLVDFDGTVVDAALATPELSTLVDAVVAAGLVDALNDAEKITVYAPTNDAFAAIPPAVTSALLADLNALTAVLTYHVSPGNDDPRRYVTPIRRDTLQGQSVFYTRFDGAARVNNAAVECAGVKASNGTVWLVDKVLLPNF